MTAVTVGTNATAAPIGFRCSSTRPFGGAHRLIGGGGGGNGGGVGIGGADFSPSSGNTGSNVRRSHGGSAPSNQFYQPRVRQPAVPASRDPVHDDGAEEDDD